MDGNSSNGTMVHSSSPVQPVRGSDSTLARLGVPINDWYPMLPSASPYTT